MVTETQMRNIFGGLISSNVLTFGALGGVLSVNTQARRLGCFVFLLGRMASGAKPESLMYSIADEELLCLRKNILLNGYSSGYLTKGASSVKHYLEAAVELGLATKQGAVYHLSNRGHFLLDVIGAAPSFPYPLRSEARTFFFNLLLRTDYFGLTALVESLLEGSKTLKALQGQHQVQLFSVLERVARQSADSRLRRMVRDRIIGIQRWNKPQSYSEHLVSAKINWLLDLNVVQMEESSSMYCIDPRHEECLRELCVTVTPTDATIAAFTLNYALVGDVQKPPSAHTETCSLLLSAFSRLVRPALLMKARCSDVILFMLCSFPDVLLRYVRHHQQLFNERVIQCGDRTYELTSASRATQAFIVSNQSRNADTAK